MKHIGHDARIQVVQKEEQSARMDGFHTPGVQGHRRKVLHIKGHDRIRPCMDCCGKDMAVLRMVGAAIDQRFKSSDICLWESGLSRAYP